MYQKRITIGNSEDSIFIEIYPELLDTAKYDPNAESDIWYLETNSSNKCNQNVECAAAKFQQLDPKKKKQLNAMKPRLDART